MQTGEGTGLQVMRFVVAMAIPATSVTQTCYSKGLSMCFSCRRSQAQSQPGAHDMFTCLDREIEV